MVHYYAYNVFIPNKITQPQTAKGVKMQNKNFNTTEIIELSLGDMIDYLEEYYECAGFEDFYDRMLKGKSEEVLREMYLNLKKIEDAPTEDL